MEQTTEQRTHQLYAALTDAERQRIKAAAALRGVPAQQWNREALLEKLSRELRPGGMA